MYTHACMGIFAESELRYVHCISDDPISNKHTRILEFTARMYTFVADFIFLLLVLRVLANM